jgi:hypothetical protein
VPLPAREGSGVCRTLPDRRFPAAAGVSRGGRLRFAIPAVQAGLSEVQPDTVNTYYTYYKFPFRISNGKGEEPE